MKRQSSCRAFKDDTMRFKAMGSVMHLEDNCMAPRFTSASAGLGVPPQLGAFCLRRVYCAAPPE
eukprot:1157889-Pelagomonas_calceolata.AAC.4